MFFIRREVKNEPKKYSHTPLNYIKFKNDNQGHIVFLWTIPNSNYEFKFDADEKIYLTVVVRYYVKKILLKINSMMSHKYNDKWHDSACKNNQFDLRISMKFIVLHLEQSKIHTLDYMKLRMNDKKQWGGRSQALNIGII